MRKIEIKAQKHTGLLLPFNTFGFWEILNTSPRGGRSTQTKLLLSRGDSRIGSDLDTVQEGVDVGKSGADSWP